MKTSRAQAGLVAAALCSALAGADTLPAGLRVEAGPVNTVVFERGGARLVVYGDAAGVAETAEAVLLTHHRRDVVYAARALAEGGSLVVAPAGEHDLLAGVGDIWRAFPEKRFHDYDQQTTKLLATPLVPGRQVKGGDSYTWEDLTFRVLDTPGFTRGAVSYVVDLDGARVVFTGDLVHGDGRVFDLYSLQDFVRGSPGAGYHGFAARLADLLPSLERVAAEEPDLIVPARGSVIRDPGAALERLATRSRAVYENVLSTDALRWHFGDDNLLKKARAVLGPTAVVDWMGTAELQELPEWVIPVQNTRVLRAADGSAFVLDCGNAEILAELRALHRSGRLASLDHVWITHYHDDHTDAVPDLVEEFGSTVYAVEEMVDVLENPAAYRLPAATSRPIPVTARLRSGATWRWKEFELTAWFFPGQTLHHQALLVTHDSGKSLLFVGDSFSPSGLDDYCPQNRVFLHEGMGYFDCLARLRELPAGTFLVNQHVPPAFRFSSAQMDRMEASLRERMMRVRDLVPWDDPNYALDEGWARVYPYGVDVKPGGRVRGRVVVMNHSPTPGEFAVRVHPPAGWAVPDAPWVHVRVPPRQEGVVPFEVEVPGQAEPGVHLLTADVDGAGHELRRWVEMLVEVEAPGP